MNAVKDDLDVYTTTKQEITRIGDNSFTLHTPDHIQWAFAGRGPGKAPPLEAMMELVKSKNILFDGMDKRGTAFAIQQYIKLNGTKNHIKNAPDIMEKTVLSHLLQYEIELGNSMSIEIQRQVKESFDKIWGAEQELLKKFKI